MAGLEAKTLLPGEQRYVVKSRREGPRTTRWYVYDRVMGSYPGQRPAVGKIKQGLTTEADAQAEADRLESTIR